MIECNYKIGEYTVDVYFPEYSIALQIYEVNDENYFDSFVEIIKLKFFF